MAISPYRMFWDWIFDNSMTTPIPQPDILLKYNTPITPVFLFKSMIKIGKLNHYLNEYLNNIGVYYLDKEELFIFIKKAIRDFKVKRKDIHYSPYKKQHQIFEKLKVKTPLLKDHDLVYFIDIIDKSNEKDSIYASFGIDKPKKQKLKKKKKVKKISLKEFLEINFHWIDM